MRKTIKKTFSAILATTVAMTFVACTEDTTELTANNYITVPFSIDAPVKNTRAAHDEEGTNSLMGGLYNVDMTKYDIRYIIEVWDANGTEKAKERITTTRDTYEAFKGTIRLTPGQKYTFAVWADFVKQMPAGTNRADYIPEDLHYTTDDLTNIAIKNYTVNDETRDAYAACQLVDIDATATTGVNISLKRPMGKVRIVSKDAQSLSFGKTIAKTSIDYTNTTNEGSTDYIPASYNLLKGKPSETAYDFNSNPIAITDIPCYTTEADAEEKTIFTDYIFVNSTGDESQISFKLTAYEEDETKITSYEFSTGLPVENNSLTTLIGNILTINAEITIDISGIDQMLGSAEENNDIDIE